MEDFQCFNDEQLQQMSVSGSVGAEDALAARYNQLVRICARPYFLAGGDSEDLTQEGMLGLLSAIREYRPTRASLSRHMRNCASGGGSSVRSNRRLV